MEEPKKTEAKPGTSGDAQPKKLVLPLAIATGIVLVALIAWLALDGDAESEGTAAAEIVTVEDLRDEAAEREAPIYWAGTQEGSEVELSEPEEGRVFVRYLTDGAEAGESRSDFLTVGTYSFPDADQALKDLGAQGGGVLAAAPGGGVVYFDRAQPQNVYLAYPDDDVQIEVFDPDPKRALELVTSGQIVPAS